MQSNSYNQRLLNQLENSSKSGINLFLKHMYGLVKKELKGQNILEVGSGPGISKKFIIDKNILQTDYLTWPNSNILSNIDASNLPFSNNQFDCAFSIDALHHISKPIDALIELIRVVKPGGKVILVEPYVSFLSYFVYKLFHEENTSWRYKIPLSGQTVSEEASAGEQGVLQAILLSKKILSLIQTSTEKELVFKKQYFSPVSFFATGGLTNPFSVSNRFIALLLDIEKKLPSRILKLVSARQIVVIKLKS